jgi:uncharacterized Zn finger protein (UPF0148 family)
MEQNGKHCPNCGKIIAEGIQFCPSCGQKQKQLLNKDEIDKNPYEILQVSEDAEKEVIEAVYKNLARKYHPDSSNTSASEEKIREINWAYGILSDPDKLEEWKSKNKKGLPTSIPKEKPAEGQVPSATYKQPPVKSASTPPRQPPPTGAVPVRSGPPPMKKSTNR